MKTTKALFSELMYDFQSEAGMSLNCRSSLCESFWPWPNSLVPLLTAPKKRSLFASSHNVNCA